MEGKQIGILMTKKIIDYGIYVFRPDSILVGEVVNGSEYDGQSVLFRDNNGIEYLTFNDSNTIECDEETVVGYVTDIDKLTEKYQGISINEAKTNYFDYICESVHIGFYIESADVIAVIMYDLRSMHNYLNSLDADKFGENLEVSIEDFEKHTRNIYSEQESKYALEDAKFDKLNNISQNEQISNNQIGQCKPVLVKNEVSGKYILDLFRASYEMLLEIEDLPKMKKSLDIVENVYTGMYVNLEEKINDGYNMMDINDFLCKITNTYVKLNNIDSLDKIKNEVSFIKENGEPIITKLLHKYDKSLERSEIKEESTDLCNEGKSQIIDVRAMKKFFDDRIIGQEEAKIDIISAIVMNNLSENSSDKNNCLLIGPTGSGKTLIVKTAAEYLDLPVEIVDTTQLTVPGYEGADIEDYLSRLIMKAGSVEKAQKGIIVFDEIDKKGTSKNSDVSGRGLLNTLLTFIEGTTYAVKLANGKTIGFDTSKLTVFATGAFTDVADMVKKNTGIGFNTNISSRGVIKSQDLVDYGNMPGELIGRLPIITQLDGHTKETLRRILMESKNSILLFEKEKLDKLGIKLEWTNGYLDAVSDRAIKLKSGARSLKATVEETIKMVRWEVLNNLENYVSILLTEKTVSDNIDCEILDKNGIYHNLKEIIENRTIIEPGFMKKKE